MYQNPLKHSDVKKIQDDWSALQIKAYNTLLQTPCKVTFSKYCRYPRSFLQNNPSIERTIKIENADYFVVDAFSNLVFEYCYKKEEFEFTSRYFMKETAYQELSQILINPKNAYNKEYIEIQKAFIKNPKIEVVLSSNLHRQTHNKQVYDESRLKEFCNIFYHGTPEAVSLLMGSLVRCDFDMSRNLLTSLLKNASWKMNTLKHYHILNNWKCETRRLEDCINFKINLDYDWNKSLTKISNNQNNE